MEREDMDRTQVSMVVVCPCGDTRMAVRRRTRLAVALTCEACGRRLSVKGGLARVRVSVGEVAWVRQQQDVVYPDPDADVGIGPPGDAQAADPAADPAADLVKPARRRRALRFALEEDQHAGVHRAMRAARVMHWDRDVLQSQHWHGTALELICADFLAGVPAPVVDALNRLDAIVDQRIDEHLAAVGRPPTDRQRRSLRASVYQDLFLTFAGAAREEANHG